MGDRKLPCLKEMIYIRRSRHVGSYVSVEVWERLESVRYREAT